MNHSAESALTQLKAWLAQKELPDDGRLPPERELCEILGVTRGGLRKALAILEQNGELWRQVGKGTFVGSKPQEQPQSVASIAEGSNPIEIMQARLMFEPMLASEAAVNATGGHLDELTRCIQQQREAQTWRQYENADNRFHRIIAEASGNSVLVSLFDQLNAVRRAVVWGRLRHEADHPPSSHHSFSQHECIVKAISDRDPQSAYQLMYDHLLAVRQALMKNHYGKQATRPEIAMHSASQG